MKCCLAVFILGLAVLTISETVSAKKYGSIGPEDIDEYLDDIYWTLKTNAKSLNLDRIPLPDTSFEVQMKSKFGTVIIQANATHQFLGGMVTVRRDGQGKIDDHEMISVFKARDLLIGGQLTLLGGQYNMSCHLAVDIPSLDGRVNLYLPEKKTESLSVLSLHVHPRRPHIMWDTYYCPVPQSVGEAISSKFYEKLHENLGKSIHKALNEAFNKTLKPFDPVSGH